VNNTTLSASPPFDPWIVDGLMRRLLEYVNASVEQRRDVCPVLVAYSVQRHVPGCVRYLQTKMLPGNGQAERFLVIRTVQHLLRTAVKLALTAGYMAV